ncbi:hypothetical protein [Motiliproteus sp. MSK22-1]|uniref:hypothetical protein n=1 Tax=Motiliproteus sp. MSK22-1 TaxID=1897630 RepID=UPI000975D241|nr:hypothetical protein [Motiliproteus sp. MSK22-1]OMH35346.1 hypothetical protein BGP75_10760 [Motiliproteus sp. MSK22-1]
MLTYIVEKMVYRVSKERHLSMLALGGVIFVIGCYMLLSAEILYGIVLLIYGAISVVLSIIFLKMHQHKYESIGFKKKSLIKEIFLLSAVIVFMVFNLIGAVSSFQYGLNKLGSAILALSIGVFVFASWRDRFLFLTVLLFIGVGLIELWR